jgi:hypothetical protein
MIASFIATNYGADERATYCDSCSETTEQQRNRLRQVFSRSHDGVNRVYDEAAT